MQVICQNGRLTLCSLCLAAAFPGTTWAQSTDAGGLSLSFGVEQGVYWKDNPDLTIPSAGSSLTTSTVLSFGLLSETDIQRLSLTGSGSLEGGNGRESGIVGPSVNLDYRRIVSSAALNLTAFATEIDVSALDFEDTTDAFGTLVTTSTTGTGTRRQKGAKASLEFGLDARFGGNVSIGETDTTYLDTTDPSLIDNTRTTAGLELRFDLTEVTTATTTLSTSRLKEQGLAAKDSESLSVHLNQDRPDGAYTATMAVSHDIVGSRQSLRFGRNLDLPTGSISADLGVAHTASGSVRPVGAVEWQHQLVRGNVSIAFTHDVISTDSDTENERSLFSMSYAHEITPTLGLSLSAAYKNSRDTATDLATKTTKVSANFYKEFTQDWGMTFGANHQIRDSAASGRAKSSTVYMTISRDFEFRP